MNIEEKVKMQLMVRGFDLDTQINHRGLIGATIDETILEVVKSFNVEDISKIRGHLIEFAKRFSYQGDFFLNSQIELSVQKYLESINCE